MMKLTFAFSGLVSASPEIACAAAVAETLWLWFIDVDAEPVEPEIV